MGKIAGIIFLVFISFTAFPQQIQLDGYFMQDSARLGERVGFVLKAQYPQSTQLIFPDSTFDFSPFVLLEKKSFISSTTEGITTDSAVYYLSNFSLEPNSFLSLPAYELSRYDSITYFSNEAEIKLKLMLDSIPEQLVFQQNNVYQTLEKPINWLMIGLIGGGILLIIGVFILLFAKKIKAIYLRNREKIRFLQFERKWKKLTTLLFQNPNLELADEIIGLWKGYLESITDEPFQEWTSSEISKNLEDPKVLQALRGIDMIIYAGKDSVSEESTQYLLEIAKMKFQEKQNQLRHERATR